MAECNDNNDTEGDDDDDDKEDIITGSMQSCESFLSYELSALGMVYSVRIYMENANAQKIFEPTATKTNKLE